MSHMLNISHKRQLDFPSTKNTFRSVQNSYASIPGALLCGYLVLGFLYFQDLLDDLLLLNQESTDDPLPNSSSREHSTIRTVHSPAIPRQPGPLVLSRPQVGDPLDLLPGDGALGPTRPLLGVLVHKPPTKVYPPAACAAATRWCSV